MSDDCATFAAAVDAELRSWDTYLERLQTSVAAKARKAREQAEAAIGEVRSRRIEVDERLAQARDAADDSSEDAWKRVASARDALEQRRLIGLVPLSAELAGRCLAAVRLEA